MTFVPVGGLVEISVGPKINYGQMTQDGWAYQFNGNFPDDVRLKRYPIQSNAGYNTMLGVWNLLPANGEEWIIGVDMALTNFTSNSGAFTTAYPPRQRCCIQTMDCSIANSITSTYNLVAGNPFMLYVKRDPQTLPKTIWTFQFGDGWTLQWMRENPPQITDPNGKTYTCKLSDVNGQAYQTDVEMRWIFAFVGGDMIIAGTHLRTSWTIPYVAVPGATYPLSDPPYSVPYLPISDAPFTLSATPSGFAFSCAPFDFQSSGYIITDFIETWQTIETTTGTTLDTAGLTEFTSRIHGTIPDGCGASVSLYAVQDGFTTNSMAQFQLTMTNASDVPGTFQTITLPFAGGPVTVAQTGYIAVTAIDLLTSQSMVITTTVLGSVTGAGTAIVTFTSALMNGGSKIVGVPVVVGSAATAATAIVAYLNADTAFYANFIAANNASATITVTCRNTGITHGQPAYVDNTCALGITNGTCSGLTASTPSTWNPVTYKISEFVGDTGIVCAQRALSILSADTCLCGLYSLAISGNTLTLTSLSLDTTDPTLAISFMANVSGLTDAATGTPGTTSTALGTATPFIGEFEVIRLPQWSMPSAVWYDITAWYEEGTLDLFKAWSSNQATLFFRHLDVFDGQNLVTLVGGLTAQLAVVIKIAYDLQDSVTLAHATPTWFTRMTGETTYREEVGGSYDSNDEPQRLQLRVSNRWAAFTRKLGLCPSLHGYTADQAIAILAQFSGVLPRDIVNMDDSVTYNTWPPPSLLTNCILTDPGKKYYEDTWQPKPNDTADTWIKKICQRFTNVRAEFGMDGLLHIWQQAYSAETPVYSYTTAPTGDPMAALAKIKYTRNTSGMVNKVAVQGETPEYNPLYAVVVDLPSVVTPGVDNYIGHVLPEYIIDTSLRNQYDVNTAAMAAFLRRQSGHPLVELTKQNWAGWILVPGQLITLTDYTTAIAGTINLLVTELHLAIGDKKGPNNITPTRIVCDTYIP
jgi:hypothetical protein